MSQLSQDTARHLATLLDGGAGQQMTVRGQGRGRVQADGSVLYCCYGAYAEAGHDDTCPTKRTTPQPQPSAPSIEALTAQRDALLALVERLTILTEDGDDQIKGAAYIDKSGVIRAKGSLLETIEQARAAIAARKAAAS